MGTLEKTRDWKTRDIEPTDGESEVLDRVALKILFKHDACFLIHKKTSSSKSCG